jgi:hypothetical protein
MNRSRNKESRPSPKKEKLRLLQNQKHRRIRLFDYASTLIFAFYLMVYQ